MNQENVVCQGHIVSKKQRSIMKSQRPCVLWFTGLSGSGKSTVAGLVEQKLADQGRHTYLMDGDNVRHGLCQDLTFSDEDRNENIRRIGEVSNLMLDAGLIVLTAFISPFRFNRDTIRSMAAKGEFIEIFIDTPLSECERRDPKGLYKKARAGEIKDFTGIDSPYEVPLSPEIRIENHGISEDAAANIVIEYLYQYGYLEQ